METLSYTIPSLKMIDPCEGCTRKCHGCGFLPEHLRVKDRKIKQRRLEEYLQLQGMNRPLSPYIPHDHGTAFDNCLQCDEEINGLNPGKRIDVTIGGRKSIIHVCNHCFLDKEFQEYISQDPERKIRNY